MDRKRAFQEAFRTGSLRPCNICTKNYSDHNNFLLPCSCLLPKIEDDAVIKMVMAFNANDIDHSFLVWVCRACQKKERKNRDAMQRRAQVEAPAPPPRRSSPEIIVVDSDDDVVMLDPQVISTMQAKLNARAANGKSANVTDYPEPSSSRLPTSASGRHFPATESLQRDGLPMREARAASSPSPASSSGIKSRRSRTVIVHDRRGKLGSGISHTSITGSPPGSVTSPKFEQESGVTTRVDDNDAGNERPDSLMTESVATDTSDTVRSSRPNVQVPDSTVDSGVTLFSPPWSEGEQILVRRWKRVARAIPVPEEGVSLAFTWMLAPNTLWDRKPQADSERERDRKSRVPRQRVSETEDVLSSNLLSRAGGPIFTAARRSLCTSDERKSVSYGPHVREWVVLCTQPTRLWIRGIAHYVLKPSLSQATAQHIRCLLARELGQEDYTRRAIPADAGKFDVGRSGPRRQYVNMHLGDGFKSSGPCSNCIEFDFECSYGFATDEPLSTTRRAPSRTLVRALRRRIYALEAIIRKRCPDIDLSADFPEDSSPASQTTAPVPPTTSSGISTSQVEGSALTDGSAENGDTEAWDESAMKGMSIDSTKYCYLGNACGVHLYRVAQKCKRDFLGREDDFDNGRPEFWSPRSWEVFSSPPITYTFPEPDLMRVLVDLYFNRMSLHFPLLHRPTFEHMLYTQKLHLTNDSFGAVVLVVCSVGATMTNDPSAHMAGWAWFHQVRFGPHRPLVTQPSLHDVQFYAIAAHFVSAGSTPQMAWPLLGYALRTLVVLDRICSAAWGRTPMADIDEFDLPYPLEVDDEYWMHGFTQPDGMHSLVSAFVAHIRLSAIQYKAMKILYSPQNLSNKTAKIWDDDVIIGLDSDLNRWLEDLPPHLRWNADNPNIAFYNQSAYLTSYYHYVRMFVHQTNVRRCSFQTSPSLNVCTNAARTCVRISEAYIKRHRRGHPFTGVSVFFSGLMLVISAWYQRKSLSTSLMLINDTRLCLDVLHSLENESHPAGRLWDLLLEVSIDPLQSSIPRMHSTPIQWQDGAMSSPVSPQMWTWARQLDAVCGQYTVMPPSSATDGSSDDIEAAARMPTELIVSTFSPSSQFLPWETMPLYNPALLPPLDENLWATLNEISQSTSLNLDTEVDPGSSDLQLQNLGLRGGNWYFQVVLNSRLAKDGVSPRGGVNFPSSSSWTSPAVVYSGTSTDVAVPCHCFHPLCPTMPPVVRFDDYDSSPTDHLSDVLTSTITPEDLPASHFGGNWLIHDFEKNAVLSNPDGMPPFDFDETLSIPFHTLPHQEHSMPSIAHHSVHSLRVEPHGWHRSSYDITPYIGLLAGAIVAGTVFALLLAVIAVPLARWCYRRRARIYESSSDDVIEDCYASIDLSAHKLLNSDDQDSNVLPLLVEGDVLRERCNSEDTLCDSLDDVVRFVNSYSHVQYQAVIPPDAHFS
ncbi:hypothetical protein FISHEDRAFT_56609 [Fistulina hepatica ATCC 64428]|uniref:Uncharacterized protein n=1 Tax=Fistulina hepatica ATCC 64428 TaxID=1128425 RepID=A0A0D7AJH6_9AGAR|nr:hypothetical protein FISHEDRAFT_56609 [Fistulina hepatica ATCC 64428]